MRVFHFIYLVSFRFIPISYRSSLTLLHLHIYLAIY